MPNCPKCGKEINTLLLYEKQIQVFKVYSGKDGLEYEWIDALDDLQDEYTCPICGEILFTKDVDAINFIMGKKDKSEVP